MNNIFDSHCHYDDHWFDDDRQQVLDRVLGEGSAVSFVNHAATDVDSALFGIECAKKYKNFYTSVGFHPEYASVLPKDWESRLEELYRLSKATGKLTAIGEIGLDYHYPGYDRDREIEVFEKQLVFAKDKDLPVIVHSRDATQDTMELLKKHGSRGVIHCFSGSAETAKSRMMPRTSSFVMYTSVCSMPMAWIMRVRSSPERPTNGRPCRSSSWPGPSPMNISRAWGSPSPGTTLVRVSHSLHFSQTPMSLYSCAQETFT